VEVTNLVAVVDHAEEEVVVVVAGMTAMEVDAAEEEAEDTVHLEAETKSLGKTTVTRSLIDYILTFACL
jgi:hypothetical protein